MTTGTILIGKACRAHDQDHLDFCGEAVEMMICANQNPPVTKFTQAALFAEGNPSGKISPLGFTMPDEVAAVLSKHLPGRGFSVQKAADAPTAMQGIIFALQNFGAPVAVLAEAGQHWVVVAVVETDLDPRQTPHYRVLNVSFNSPNTVSAALPPTGIFPHTDADICCACRPGETAGYRLPYDEWLGSWLTSAGPTVPITYVCATQAATLKARLAAKLPAVASFLENLAAGVGLGNAPQPEAGGTTLAPDIPKPDPPLLLPPLPLPSSQEQMVAESRRGLTDMSLGGADQRTELDLLDGAEPGTALRVDRLDAADSHYFLLPWSLDGKTVATTAINGSTGRFAGLQYHGGPWFPELGAESPARLQRLSQLGIDPAAVPDPPGLVWKPSRESFSPHVPFLRLSSDQHQAPPAGEGPADGGVPAGANGSGAVVLRVDGSRFEGLTLP